MIKRMIIIALVWGSLLSYDVLAQLPPVFGEKYEELTQDDPRVRKYISPLRIVWQSDESGKTIENAAKLLKPGNGQAELINNDLCILRSTDTEKPGILLDFGKELHGGLQLVTGMMASKDPVKVRIRFGESVSEAMSDIDTINGATNDHAMRDFIVELPWLGSLQVGNSGFRFVRIDLVDPNVELLLKEARAVFIYRDVPYLGSFKSNDERLNQIWETGAYTVHLNMQQYLWDGIKRDRLVWVGDLHPEVMTVNAVFGYNEVVPKSLDLIRDATPLPQWMNGISSYSLWWIIIHRDWYNYHGDLEYLKEQEEYLKGLLSLLLTKIDGNKEALDGMRFLDWPSSENEKAIHAGLQALMVMALDAGAELSQVLGENTTAGQCEDAVARLRKHVPDHGDSKQAAAMLTLAGMMDGKKANKQVIAVGGAENFSTFYGYYMLHAKAVAGDYQGALDNIREYWGGMLDLGATTFWEDFDLSWLENAAPIDEIVPEGKTDVHAAYGNYSYKQLRHSLCHGWASGPTSWLTRHVLGVSVVEPGSKVIRIEPHLADLEWVEGTFPTPYGAVKIKHTKKADGSIATEVDAPDEVKVLK
ncbi:alpha-L-rhamnosidase-like protein [Anseongella ginsenosidimutans]|uniref:Alpha-L-rhamnosidase-like protein n=1 Tax=Anseongella ginsenosidimutans TaxID=496056 RepID=A0A4R3KPB5_9SPHI|nr:alpha-L-rhamnosidase C-terminal domain-containing protein [Anseongella ginsenosidimutans]QEC52590.1 Bacterial alpha-L-rhamnosidase [Anseongella ginsenosidimutans]TCS86508.1 alpha-L-rhamnosidase-like protein [Anseongella ginsenosidimutans]